MKKRKDMKHVEKRVQEYATSFWQGFSLGAILTIAILIVAALMYEHGFAEIRQTGVYNSFEELPRNGEDLDNEISE